MINSGGWYYFTPITNNTISATTSSASVALGSEGTVLMLMNEGAATVFVALGDSGVAAVSGASATAANTGSFPVPAGAIISILVAPSVTHAAAISLTGTCVLRVVRGRGV